MEDKITIVNQIEARRNGDVGIQLASFLVADGVQVSESELHRVTIEPGWDAQRVFDLVNQDIVARGRPAVPESEWARVLRHVVVAHTPELCALRTAQREAQAAREAADNAAREAQQETDRQDAEARQAAAQDALKAMVAEEVARLIK